MNHMSISPVRCLRRWNLVAAVALAVPITAFAQATPPDHAAHQAAGKHPPTTAPAGVAAPESIADLQAKVAKLEAALQAKAGGMAAADKPMPNNSMPMGDNSMGAKPMGGMTPAMPMPADKPMMDDDKGMAAMGGGKMSGGMPMPMPMMDKMMPMMDQMMGMMGMPPGVGANATPMPTALPGFPGASHVYHIGSTGFFLDHGQHITLSVDQQTSLSALKEKALLEKATGQRAIDAAEQDLWSLTASDRPDAAAIESKIHEIEKLRGDQRLSFIREVGAAASLLTDAQRQSLLGQMPPQTQQPDPAAMPMPAAPATPATPAGGMPDM